MWRCTIFGFLIVVAVMCVVVSASAQQGDETVTDDEVGVPAFLIEVYVGPLGGPMHIPPGDRSSLPYTASVRIFDSEVGEFREFWSLPRRTMYAGDTIEEDGLYGPYRIMCTVTIDERGEMAEVQIKLEWMDGDELIRASLQRFTAHLPPSQLPPG
jgi:hypothetical protein